jgi:L-lactate dehydrogenase complex protein LldG
MSSRDRILARLSSLQQSDPAEHYQRDSFSEQLHGSAAEHFVRLAAEQLATVERVQHLIDVPAAVRRYLRTHELPARLVVDASAGIGVDTFSCVDIQAEIPPLNPDNDTLLSGCYGAVAESGALVISTADGHAIANDFLAATHIVLLPVDRIFATLPDLWASLRIEQQGRSMPREFCLVAGPSRTADLGVPAKMGAHGPARVHILLLGT